ncbi:MAG: endonuclease domain-containing protein [Deltaproteobacteria bacterium]|nr:endonuclease domain-containing protein [Deltaproteobacteria bacterium]
MLPYNRHLKVPSQKLRKEMTEAERKLWFCIREKQILGVQFYRQKPIANFIVDFFAPKAKLVIEVDGGQHREEHQRVVDQERDGQCFELGLEVLRLDNEQVLKETDVVLERIEKVVAERIKSPLKL